MTAFSYPLAPYLVGAMIVVGAACIADVAAWAYRRIRPPQAKCQACDLPGDLDVFIRLGDGDSAWHQGCLDDATAPLNGFAGTWRDLRDHRAVQEVH